jgi:SDR family mycofactocin-dependent oxidoreductase
MSELFRGKIVAITGAGRGQGRSHAVRFAEEGADVIVIDICDDIPGLQYGLATKRDLEETVQAASVHGTRVRSRVADVRDPTAISGAIDECAAELGGLDIVSVNAGIAPPFVPTSDIADELWRAVIAVNLTGAFNTARAAVPHLRARGGGSIIFTASVAGVQGMANLGAYVASKHGVVGLMKTMAMELGPENIRVNAVLPTSVATPMLLNSATYELMRPDLEAPQLDDVVDVLRTIQVLPIAYVDPEDVTNAVVFLASDAARCVTGVALPVDGGALHV